MCWNASVSINTFALGVFAGLLALFNNLLTAFEFAGYMSFVSMQLLEFFIWKDIDAKRFQTILSIAGIVLILSQPLMSILGMQDKATYRSAFTLMLALFAVFVAIYVFWELPKLQLTNTVASNGHLKWNWVLQTWWLVALFVAFICVPKVLDKNWLTLAAVLMTFAVSGVMNYEYGTWGSVWCYLISLSSVYFLYRVFAKEFCKP